MNEIITLKNTVDYLVHREEEKQSFKNNKSKTLGETWDEEFELVGGYCTISVIQGYSKNVIKEHETLA